MQPRSIPETFEDFDNPWASGWRCLVPITMISTLRHVRPFSCNRGPNQRHSNTWTTYGSVAAWLAHSELLGLCRSSFPVDPKQLSSQGAIQTCARTSTTCGSIVYTMFQIARACCPCSFMQPKSMNCCAHI